MGWADVGGSAVRQGGCKSMIKPTCCIIISQQRGRHVERGGRVEAKLPHQRYVLGNDDLHKPKNTHGGCSSAATSAKLIPC